MRKKRLDRNNEQQETRATMESRRRQDTQKRRPSSTDLQGTRGTDGAGNGRMGGGGASC